MAKRAISITLEADNVTWHLSNRTMVEIEYGLTDRWDLAVYNMFDVAQRICEAGGGECSGGTGYAGLKLETRFRLSLPGEWPVDPVLYFEYQHLLRGDANDKLEAKLILGRDFGPWNVAVTFGTGFVFLSLDRHTPSLGARLLTWGFLLWGLHHLDYPLLRAQVQLYL